MNALTIQRQLGARWAGRAAALTALGLLAPLVGCDGESSADRGRGSASEARPAVMVLVAASASSAVAEIAAAFQREQAADIRINAGPSNAFVSQIIAGAPADLFIPASEAWADAVRERDLADQVQRLVTSTLVIVVPRGNPAGVHAPADLVNSKVRKVALAGENVPAGLYGAQALASADVYEPLVGQRKFVRGHDVRVTLSYVELGEAEAGIVYRTDALLSQRVETAYAFPPSSHEPIVYPLVLLKRAAANPAAREFLDHLQSRKAKQVFERHGFRLLDAPNDERQAP